MTCRACGLDHAPTVRCEIHKRLTDATNKELSATNNVRAVERMENGSSRSGVAAGSGNQDEHADRNKRGEIEASKEPSAIVVAVKTKNRRTREAYNAYQREYMRKRRVQA